MTDSSLTKTKKPVNLRAKKVKRQCFLNRHIWTKEPRIRAKEGKVD